MARDTSVGANIIPAWRESLESSVTGFLLLERVTA